MKVPMSLHEDTIFKFQKRDSLTGEIAADAALQGLGKALQSAREGAEKIAALAATRDPTITAEAQALLLKDKALQNAEKAAATIDQARDRTLAEIARLEADTAAPPAPKDALALQIETEIRSRLANMKDGDRMKAITDALASGDDAVIGAALRGPVFLTGMGNAEREHVRHQWRTRHFPEETDRVERLRKAVAAVERGARSLLRFTQEIASSGSVGLAEAEKRRADEAVAALAAE